MLIAVYTYRGLLRPPGLLPVASATCSDMLGRILDGQDSSLDVNQSHQVICALARQT